MTEVIFPKGVDGGPFIDMDSARGHLAVGVEFEIPAVVGEWVVSHSLLMGDDAMVDCSIVAGDAFEKFFCYYVRVGEMSRGAFEWVVEVLGGVVGYEESEGLRSIVGVVLKEAVEEAVAVTFEAPPAGKDWFRVSTFESCAQSFELTPVEVVESPGVLRDDFVDRWGALWVGRTAGVAGAGGAAAAGTTATASPGQFRLGCWVVNFLEGSAGVCGGVGW